MRYARDGIRNSDLLSIAPTGTVSLAFADNASNGIEPAFSWTYTRMKVMADGSRESFEVEDYAYRLYRELGGDVKNLPDYFVSALEMSARDHLDMMAAVQPYVDTSISKTVNVPADYPFEAFESLYFDAWKNGLKGLATYRPNETLGAVLSVSPRRKQTIRWPRADQDPLRIAIDHRPKGELPAIIEKVEYLTQAGKKSLYVAVSFIEVTGRLGGEEVTIERPIEFFIPTGSATNRSNGSRRRCVRCRSRHAAVLSRATCRICARCHGIAGRCGSARCSVSTVIARRAGMTPKWRRSPLRSSRFCTVAAFSMPKAIRCRRGCWRVCRVGR